jgi:hypothetical protein
VPNDVIRIKRFPGALGSELTKYGDARVLFQLPLFLSEVVPAAILIAAVFPGAQPSLSGSIFWIRDGQCEFQIGDSDGPGQLA